MSEFYKQSGLITKVFPASRGRFSTQIRDFCKIEDLKMDDPQPGGGAYSATRGRQIPHGRAKQ